MNTSYCQIANPSFLSAVLWYFIWSVTVVANWGKRSLLKKQTNKITPEK